MPAAITYGTPKGGGYLATVPGTSSVGLGGPGGGMGWLSEAARRSAQNKLRKQSLELKEMERAYRTRPSRFAPKSYAERQGERAQAEAATTEIMKQRAMRQAAPKKWIGGAGLGFGAQIEAPEDYSGIQRQIFLPQGASFSGPSLPEMDEAGRSRSISDLQRMRIEQAQHDAARRALAGSDLYSPNPNVASYEWAMRGSEPPQDVYARRRPVQAPEEQSWDDWYEQFQQGYGG